MADIVFVPPMAGRAVEAPKGGPAPLIVVFINTFGSFSGPVLNGDAPYGGPGTAGTPIVLNVTIQNNGVVDLNLGPIAEVPVNATVTPNITPTTPVPGMGGTTTYQIQLTPLAGGPASVEISIPNDTPLEDPFVFTPNVVVGGNQ